ncbi:MAG: rod shape-determining protein MreC [Actinomycetota bacterium]
MVTRQRPRSTRLLVVVLVSISLAVITLDYREGPNGPLAGLGRGALAAMAPLQEAVTTVTRPVGNWLSGLVHLSGLQGENAALRRENAALRTEIQHNAYLEGQAQQLEQMLGLQQSLSPPSVAALVIANGLSNFQWTITINKGSVDGIAVDQPVITGSAAAPELVGRVLRVTPISAEVQLIIDRGSAGAARLSVSRETGLVEGQGDGDLRMTLVNPSTVVEGNETVVTQGYVVNGQRGLYPPGLVIGQVSHVIPGASDLQEFVTVRPAVEFDALQSVLVLQTSQSEG